MPFEEVFNRRIPHLGHFALMLALTLFSLAFCEALLATTHPHAVAATLKNPVLQLFANALTYFCALGAASLLFPLLWNRRFADGLAWNGAAVRFSLLPFGVLLGFASQAASTLLPIPKHLPIEKEFLIPGLIWFLAIFGTFIAPLFEEIVFRGFLLPALANAFDYLRLERSMEAHDTWRGTPASNPALLFASIATSMLFAAIHAPQLGFNAAPIALLFVVSMVLCAVRIRLRSVAASTVVHVCYNFSIFLTLFAGTGGFRHMDRL